MKRLVVRQIQSSRTLPAEKQYPIKLAASFTLFTSWRHRSPIWKASANLSSKHVPYDVYVAKKSLLHLLGPDVRAISASWWRVLTMDPLPEDDEPVNSLAGVDLRAGVDSLAGVDLGVTTAAPLKRMVEMLGVGETAIGSVGGAGVAPGPEETVHDPVPASDVQALPVNPLAEHGTFRVMHVGSQRQVLVEASQALPTTCCPSSLSMLWAWIPIQIPMQRTVGIASKDRDIFWSLHNHPAR
jgi:hypothetical protein